MSFQEILCEELGIEVTIAGMEIDPDGIIHGKFSPQERISVQVQALAVTSTLTLALRIPGGKEEDDYPKRLARWKGTPRNIVEEEFYEIFFDLNGKGTIKMPKNSFYVLEAQQEKALGRVWQLSIVRQGNEHHFRVQLLHEFPVYKEWCDGKAYPLIVDQKFNTWWNCFTGYFKTSFKAKDLPDSNGAIEWNQITEYADLTANQARIVWWNESRNRGYCILQDGRQILARYEECDFNPEDDVFISFEPGQVINYRGIQHNRLQGITPA